MENIALWPPGLEYRKYSKKRKNRKGGNRKEGKGRKGKEKGN